MEPNAYAGIGFLSNIVRVQFEDPAQDVSKSFIAKLLPVITDDYTRDVYNVLMSERFDQRELFFYQALKSELVQICPELDKYLAQCVHAEVQTHPEYASVLIFEDLKPLGYIMPGFDTGLTQSQLSQAIDFAATFHSAGIALCHQKGALLPEIHPMLKDWHFPCKHDSGSDFKSSPSLAWFKSGLVTIDQALTENPNMNATKSLKIRNSYARLVPHTDQIIELLVTAGSQFPTIIHDDLWPHNFLVSESSIKVIDWQLAAFTDPTYDLSVLFLSCFGLDEINEREILGVLEVYYRKMSGIGESERSLKELSEFFKTFGLSYALVWFAMSCDSIYSNCNYRKKLIRILEFLNEMKVLDFILKQISVN